MAIVFNFATHRLLCEECNEKGDDATVECSHGRFYFDYDLELIFRSIPLPCKKFVNLNDSTVRTVIAEVPRLRRK